MKPVDIQHVLKHVRQLKVEGKLEATLLDAYLACPDDIELNHKRVINAFKACDKIKLQGLGRIDLPWDLGCITVFRGVNGNTKGRRILGLSWSVSIRTACWFATRLNGNNPQVFVAQLNYADVACWVNRPPEVEVIAWPKRFYQLVIPGREIKTLAKEYGLATLD